MALNDVSDNGRSPLQGGLAERRYWAWESAVRGLGLSALLADDRRAEELGLRTWTRKEREQRAHFRYDHAAERLGYRHPTALLEMLSNVRLALDQERVTGVASGQPLPELLPKDRDDGVLSAFARLELACRLPWRTPELFGWTDEILFNDAAEQLDLRGTIDFSSKASVERTIEAPIRRVTRGEAEQPTSAKSLYWLRLTKDEGREEKPPMGHVWLLKDTADFGANDFLRLLYLFGPAPTGLVGQDNPVTQARQERRRFDEARFVSETLKQLTGGKQDIPASDLAAYQARIAAYLERLKDPARADPRLSLAVCEVIKQALLRFKYWLDEPFRCSNEKLQAARKEFARKETGFFFGDGEVATEMTYWSENHYVLHATAEYLAGQLWPNELFVPGKDFQDKDNPAGAMTGAQRMRRAKPRLLKWLNHRIMLGWSEWNSPGYYREHVSALYNLVDLCLDEEVRTKASIALDLLAFDVARLNHRGSFGVAAARAQSKFKVSGWAQSIGDWAEFLFARRGAFADTPSALAVIAAGSAYQVPDVILEIGSMLPRRAVLDTSRVSIHFNEQTRYGLRTSEASGWAAQLPEINHQIATSHQEGYNQADDDTVFWWGRGAYFNKQVINDTVRLLEKYGLGKTDPFAQYEELFGGGMNTGEDILAGVGAIAGAAVGTVIAGPFGTVLGAAGGALGIGALLGKGAMRPAIMGGRIGASTAAFLTLGPLGLILSIPLAGWPFGDDEDHADDISLFVDGSTLSRANIYTWRDRGAMLSSLQNFRPTQLNFQSSACHAVLSTEASVWSNAPFAGADLAGIDVMDANHTDGVGWWTGNWSSPRVVQFENAAILAYRPVGIQTELHANCSHCWFPRAAFDEFKQGVRPTNVEGDDEGSWAFGKVAHADGVEGYIGVYSARAANYLNQRSEFYAEWLKKAREPLHDLDKKRMDTSLPQAERLEAAAEWKALTSRWAGLLLPDFFAHKDLYAEDDNIWIIQVGSSDEFGSYQTFRDEVARARIHVNLGDMQCSYDIPRRQRLELHTDISDDEAREKGRFRYLGERLQTDLYPRYNSPYVRTGRVEWGQPNFAIDWKGYNAWYLFDQPTEPVRVLNKQHSDKEAALIRGLALRIRTEHESMEEETVARATVRVGGNTVVSNRIVARGEVEEHTDHDVEWMLFGPVDGTQPMTLSLQHGPSNPSDDDEPHWRMRFQLWALTADARLLPCKIELNKAANYNTRKVRHLNFEDEHRSSGELPITIEDL
jgi:hypothetical protein